MTDPLQAPWVREMVHTTANMYRQGWDERNGGNISLLLSEDEILPYVNPENVVRTVPLGFGVPELAGAYLLVTGAGKYFKNVERDPARCLGLLRVTEGGDGAQLLWGLTDGGAPTSELPAHLLSHVARLAVDPANRVVLHCHPVNLLAMTHVHSLDERAFTRTLWGMCTECLMVFPDGVAVLPWMVCGTRDIGEATARKVRDARLVVWALHGIYGVGAGLDEAFGLVEVAEKAAEVYLKIAALPRRNAITDAQLRALADALSLSVREGYLE